MFESVDSQVESSVGEVVRDPPDGDPIYRPGVGELQLTLRAVAIGCGLGVVVCAMNLYFGLKTGWGIGGSLIAAILSYAAFSALKPRRAFTPLETNIAQTAGSAAGSMTMTAGLVAPIPALTLLGYDLGFFELLLWSASVAWLGVFFAVPLRRQMILSEKLRFPTGTATANTIVAMFGSGSETVRKARALLWWAGVAGAFVLIAYFIPECKQPPLTEWFPVAWLTVPEAFTFSLYVSPLLYGAGILVGMRVSVSLVVGAVLAWGVLAPWAQRMGWVTTANASYGVDGGGWVLWPGVAIMVSDALASLALSWRSIVNTFRGKKEGEAALEDPREAIPNSWWIGGLCAASVLTVVSVSFLFGLAWELTILAIALSSVLAMIATRSTGETDINPISGVGKVTQLVYGGLAPGQIGTNLLTAGITGAGAVQAGDMMQDLKTGHLLGASPRKQFIAQLFGVGAGVLICVPMYLLLTEAYPIGSTEFPAPSAKAWKAVAELLARGLGSLPTNAGWAVLAGVLFGIAGPVLRKHAPATKPYLPSGLAFGIAFIIPAFYAIPFLVGAVAYAIWRKMRPSAAEALAFAVASGLIAGDGLMGVISAILKLAGVPTVT